MNQQARQDAMADAETLRVNDSSRVPSTRSDLELATWLALTALHAPAGTLYTLTRDAARAAFRAVPALRGE